MLFVVELTQLLTTLLKPSTDESMTDKEKERNSGRSRVGFNVPPNTL